MNIGQRRAILIGSSSFSNERKLEALNCPLNDVDGMQEILTEKELGNYQNVYPLKNVDSNIAISRIEEVLNEAVRQDQILLYYSGHGVTDDDGNLYLAMANTDLRRLVATAIPVQMLQLLMRKSKCRTFILILDCCYSGGVTSSLLKKKAQEEVKQTINQIAKHTRAGLYILTATSPSGYAYENDYYSLLTKHIISGILEGAADLNHDGQVSMDELCNYVSEKVQGESDQEPMWSAHGVRGGTLVFAYTNQEYARKQVDQMTEKMVEVKHALPPKLFRQSIRAIEERRKPFHDLIVALTYHQLPVDEFVRRWDFLEGLEQVRPPKPRPSPPVPQPPSSGLRAFVKRHRLIFSSLAAAVLLSGALTVGMAVGSVLSPPPMPLLHLPCMTPSPFETKTLDSKGGETTRDLVAQSFIEDDLPDGIQLKMVRIDGGKFKMGSPDKEAGHERNEEPRHEVTVPEFFLGRYEITRRQWRQVAGWQKIELDLNPDPSDFKDSDDQPVAKVTWEEAVEFCKRLSKKTSKDYRLPSEAEWEYAARAGTVTPYAFGQMITSNLVNFHASDDSRNRPVAVGSLKVPNAFGLFDLHGNVWEWCEDHWHRDYNGAPADGSPWIDSQNQSLRVIRGESFVNGPQRCRSARRYMMDAQATAPDIGLRIALSVRKKYTMRELWQAALPVMNR
ncbi:MAG TPA: SUMF1/EgtB/PvdO family nonheme iron enzyme [Blastocatellia bacterium]|nr:SUMF1/EgtB/PvdO family nonheme iron enzyme [Blastocatellia bacterium]